MYSVSMFEPQGPLFLLTDRFILCRFYDALNKSKNIMLNKQAKCDKV